MDNKIHCTMITRAVQITLHHIINQLVVKWYLYLFRIREAEKGSWKEREVGKFKVGKFGPNLERTTEVGKISINLEWTIEVRKLLWKLGRSIEVGKLNLCIVLNNLLYMFDFELFKFISTLQLQPVVLTAKSSFNFPNWLGSFKPKWKLSNSRLSNFSFELLVPTIRIPVILVQCNFS